MGEGVVIALIGVIGGIPTTLITQLGSIYVAGKSRSSPGAEGGTTPVTGRRSNRGGWVVVLVHGGLWVVWGVRCGGVGFYFCFFCCFWVIYLFFR